MTKEEFIKTAKEYCDNKYFDFWKVLENNCCIDLYITENIINICLPEKWVDDAFEKYQDYLTLI